MSNYSAVNDDYKMFDNKMPLDETENTEAPTEEEMIRYMFNILNEYNRSLNAGTEPTVDPLNGRVVMRLRNGRTYEIPERIQRFAIARYVEATREGAQQR